MIWFMVLQVVATLVELVQLGRSSESEKDLEILLLRRQLAIYERQQSQPMRLSRGEKLTLVVLGTSLILLGVYPSWLTDLIGGSLGPLLK